MAVASKVVTAWQQTKSHSFLYLFLKSFYTGSAVQNENQTANFFFYNMFLLKQEPSRQQEPEWTCTLYKKVTDFPVFSQDVIYQSLPGRE